MSSAAILVGGRARRLGGRDKSGLLVDGRPILERLIDALLPLTADILLVGRARPADASALPVRGVPDRVPDKGPLGGLDTALAEARSAPILVVACDMPFVTTALLGRLCSLSEGVDAAVPRTGRGLHPLCAAYHTSCRPAVAQHLAAGRLKMLDLLASLNVRVLDDAELRKYGDPGRLLANVNTFGEYASVANPPGHHNG